MHCGLTRRTSRLRRSLRPIRRTAERLLRILARSTKKEQGSLRSRETLCSTRGMVRGFHYHSGLCDAVVKCGARLTVGADGTGT